ncbi:hypothetical protein B0H10DRAFT_47474 [Mycena sp. CBHHK59/15]|nr:hypothetical protein B0H10DRAFT_47474 [Mycena sp. CBHHK59/15]
MTAESSTAKTEKNGLCTTCNGPHRTDECWGKGGAMEGKRDEVLERRAARRKEKESKQTEKPSTTTNVAKPPAKPRFAMKDGNSKTVYFTMVDDDADTAATATTAVGGITLNSELEELYETYHARRDSNTSDYSMLADKGHIAFAAIVHSPFAADTGATVTLSPVKGDFYTLQAIIPQRIWGVGGTYIEAIAKGDICVRSDDGQVFILRNALYVPAASMRLFSIGCIADEDHTATFTNTGFWITNTGT